MRKAFTLIEILIAITILSIMMLFLYKSYSSLNVSNDFYKNEYVQIKNTYLKKKVFFLDFALSHKETTKIINQDIKKDVVFMQSSNSVHKRHNPYIAYIVENSKLYRLESLHEFTDYPLNVGDEYVADYLGEVNSFRVYASKDDNLSYLVHVDFKKDEDILLKTKALTE